MRVRGDSMNNRKVVPSSINKYYSVNLVINSAVFALAFVAFDTSGHTALALGVIITIITLVAIFVSKVINGERKSKIRGELYYKNDLMLGRIVTDDLSKVNIADKHTSPLAVIIQSLFPIRLTGKIGHSKAINHYPISGATIYPIFSLYHTLNFIALTNAIVFSAMYLMLGGIMLGGLSMAFMGKCLLVGGIGLLANNLVYLPRNIKGITNTLRIMKFHKTALVSMDYSNNELVAMIKKHKGKPDFKERNSIIGDLDFLALIESAVSTSMRLNDLIASRHCDPLGKLHQIEVLEYILNVFVVSSIKEIDNFFTEHKQSKQVALSYFSGKPYRVFKSNIGGFRSLISSLNTELRQIEAHRDDALLEKQQAEIKLGDGLLLLMGEKAQSNELFPEYNLLEFGRLENRLLAQKLMSENLPKLKDALKEVSSPEQKERVEYAIVRTKKFVMSIADNTAESVERNARIDNERLNDPLYINSNSHISDSIDRMLDIEERYINSHDKHLPKTNPKKGSKS